MPFSEPSNSTRDIPLTKFKKAIGDIKNRLESKIGSKGLQDLISKINVLTLYTHGSKAIEELMGNIQDPEERQDIKGIILLIRPGALMSSKYPANIKSFVNIFDVQQDDLGYLNPENTDIGDRIKYAAMEVLGSDT